VTSANVAQWHKADGEAVAKGDTLLTIETDKVSQEIEAEEAGTLKASAAPAAAPVATPAEPVAATPAVSAPAGGSGAVVDVIVPNAGESVTSANVANWHVANGAAVAKGDNLVTLETDKVSTELEAEVSGTIEILIQEGEEVGIGTVVAKITEGATSAAPAAATPAAPASTPAAATPAAPAKPAPAAAKPDQV